MALTGTPVIKNVIRIGGGTYNDVDIIQGTTSNAVDYEYVISVNGQGVLQSLSITSMADAYIRIIVDTIILYEGIAVYAVKNSTQATANSNVLNLNLNFNSYVTILAKVKGTGYTCPCSVLATIGY